MTDLLQKAFDKASKLPAQGQDELAAWILRELESEERWQSAFSASQGVLASLADEALAEAHQGRAQTLNPDKL
jgi:hypothetical protein